MSPIDMELLTPLLPHQRPAVEKLRTIKVGALYMEMGTGKTRTALDLIAQRLGVLPRIIWNMTR